MTLNLSLRLWAVMAEEERLTGSGPSLHSQEEAWTLRRLSQWETGESIPGLICPSSKSRAGICLPGRRQGQRSGASDLEEAKIGEDRSTTWVRGLQPGLGLLRTPKPVLFPHHVLVSSALCYQESILNRNLNGFCHDFWWEGIMLTFWATSTDEVITWKSSLWIPRSVLEILLTPGCL